MSEATFIRPCTRVYLVLMALTGITFMIGAAGLRGLWISLPTLGLALLKGHLVGDYFMGLRGLRSFWRWVIFIWLFIPGVLIVTAFVLTERG